MPRVSVVIPTFNCAAFLGRALGSALEQTYKDFEVIVVDDGSTDGTKEVVGRFEGQVAYYYQQNQGLSAARNVTLSKANGELFAYLDADDMWSPQKLEKQVAFLDAHPECGFVHSDVAVMDDDDRFLYRSFNRETGREVPQGACVKDLLRRCHVQILSVLERRECTANVGGFDERLLVAQDYFRWIMIASYGWQVGYVEESLAMYRWRKGSLLSNPRRLVEDEERICRILLGDQEFRTRVGEEAAVILSNRFYAIAKELAYLDRKGGRNQSARGRIAELIKEWPVKTELYVEYLKSCLPLAFVTKRDGRLREK
ncbi:MAG: glycosyltransferase [Nitrospira sp.]